MQPDCTPMRLKCRCPWLACPRGHRGHPRRGRGRGARTTRGRPPVPGGRDPAPGRAARCGQRDGTPIRGRCWWLIRLWCGVGEAGQVGVVAVSERVVLYLLPLGVVVTWFVTGWRPAVPGPGQSRPAAADPKPIRERHLRAVLAEYQAQLQHGPAAPGHRPAHAQR